MDLKNLGTHIKDKMKESPFPSSKESQDSEGINLEHFKEYGELFPLGGTETGIAAWNSETPLFIHGKAGIGKTTLLKKMALQCVSNPDLWDLFVFSTKESEFSSVAQKCSTKVVFNLSNPEETNEALGRISEEVKRRIELVRPTSSFKDTGEKRVLVLIDGFNGSCLSSSDSEEGEQAYKKLSSIVRLGRAAGTGTCIADQRELKRNRISEIRDNLVNRLDLTEDAALSDKYFAEGDYSCYGNKTHLLIRREDRSI